jgi:preprotein translocase YajC subunit
VRVAEFLLLVVPVIAAFYFILVRPVVEQQKRRRRDISHLQIGDEVLTTGGFYAVVRDIYTREDGPLEIMLEAAPGVQLRGTAEAIASITRSVAEPSVARSGRAGDA